MSLHLITGYAGEEHITSADQGAYNMGTYGEGEFVLKRGNKFAATVISANSITIADGEAMMQGRFIKLAAGTTESITIDNGTQGMNRKDIICIHYERDSSTGVESASFVVKKGTESSGTPADPSYTHGDITDGNDLVNEMPLYRVNLTGLTISSIDTMYSLKVSMVDYMDNYQLPVAAYGTLGGVKVGSNGISIDTNNRLKLVAPTASSLGGIKTDSSEANRYSNGIYIDGDGVIKEYPAHEFNGAGFIDEAFVNPVFILAKQWSIELKISISKGNFCSLYQVPTAIKNASDSVFRNYLYRNFIITGIDLRRAGASSSGEIFGFTCNGVHLNLDDIGSGYVSIGIIGFNNLVDAEFYIKSFALYGVLLHAS